MRKIKKEIEKRNEMVNTLIDLFGIREIIDEYLKWLEMSYEDLLFIYTCETERHQDFDYFDDYGDCYD